MAATLKLKIVTPEAKTYSEDVEMVTLPGVTGQFGVYPQHVPLMTQMVPGEIIVSKDGRDTFFATGGGLIEVTASRVSILTDLAVRAALLERCDGSRDCHRKRVAERQRARAQDVFGQREGERRPGVCRREPRALSPHALGPR